MSLIREKKFIISPEKPLTLINRPQGDRLHSYRTGCSFGLDLELEYIFNTLLTNSI